MRAPSSLHTKGTHHTRVTRALKPLALGAGVGGMGRHIYKRRPLFLARPQDIRHRWVLLHDHGTLEQQRAVLDGDHSMPQCGRVFWKSMAGPDVVPDRPQHGPRVEAHAGSSWLQFAAAPSPPREPTVADAGAQRQNVRRERRHGISRREEYSSGHGRRPLLDSIPHVSICLLSTANNDTPAGFPRSPVRERQVCLSNGHCILFLLHGLSLGKSPESIRNEEWIRQAAPRSFLYERARPQRGETVPGCCPSSDIKGGSIGPAPSSFALF